MCFENIISDNVFNNATDSKKVNPSKSKTKFLVLEIKFLLICF